MEKKNDFKPFISADKVLPEFTVTSVILGMIWRLYLVVQTLIWG